MFSAFSFILYRAYVFTLWLINRQSTKTYAQCVCSSSQSCLQRWVHMLASRFNLFTPGDRTPVTRWIRSWVAPRTRLDILEKSKYWFLVGKKHLKSYIRQYKCYHILSVAQQFYLYRKWQKAARLHYTQASFNQQISCSFIEL